jgi:phosphonate transport system permease protein
VARPTQPDAESRGVSSAQFAAFERAYAEQRRRKQWQTAAYGGLFLASVVAAAIAGHFDLQRLAVGLPKAWAYIQSTLPTLRAEHLAGDLDRWYWGLALWLRLLGETVIMGFVGTALGAAAALILCFPASRNLIGGHATYFLCRRLLEIARTVPDLVYALIFVYAFGVGPLAGVLALATHSAGALGKLFSEVNENVDRHPIEGVTAAGGAWPVVMRIAVLPQVLPDFVSYALLRFEINVRSASVLGIVGAGGIGDELYLAVRQFEYTDISAILLLIMVLVAVIDMSCEAVRHRLIGRDTLQVA